MDVQTGAGGQAKVDLTAIVEDLIPAADEEQELGSEDKKWAALWVAIALVTSIVVGGVVNISTMDSWLFINASTWINESLNVSGNITAANITADYFFGDGSGLTGITVTETDPLWTSNFTAYNSSWSSTYNATYDAKVSFPGWDSNLAWQNQTNIFTANQNLTGINITAINCVIFDSGGKICSGV